MYNNEEHRKYLQETNVTAIITYNMQNLTGNIYDK